MEKEYELKFLDKASTSGLRCAAGTMAHLQTYLNNPRFAVIGMEALVPYLGEFDRSQLIDMALDTKDEAWFRELVSK